MEYGTAKRYGWLHGLPGGCTLAVLLLAVAAMAGCSNVELSPAGEKVEVMATRMEMLDQCENMGKVRTTAKNINAQREARDREIIARNEAVSMGGNVIVPAGEVENNAQRWDVFKCN